MAKRSIKGRAKPPLGKDAGGDPHNHLPVGSLDGVDAFVAGWGLDPGIEHYVAILRSQGIETCESCQGGPGHCYSEPTVAFHGDKGEGPRAVAVALTYGLPVGQLRRVWDLRGGEIEGPLWQLTFAVTADCHLKDVKARSDRLAHRIRSGRNWS